MSEASRRGGRGLFPTGRRNDHELWDGAAERHVSQVKWGMGDLMAGGAGERVTQGRNFETQAEGFGVLRSPGASEQEKDKIRTWGWGWVSVVCVSGWKDRHMNGWMDGRMGRQMDGQSMDGKVG